MSETAIELKRIVMVKAIVTEAFKDNLVKELERAIRNMDGQMQQIENQSKAYMEDLKKKGMMQQITTFRNQLNEERAKMTASKNDLLMKVEEAKKLVLGSEFIQGPLEGPVNVKVGDNLYRKVGAAEILVKDGVIMEIRNIE
ncbi:MAG: YlqD family protein [Candidatus Saganbacteria bacterium]|nr:YlqD family protein [Candidatus Saganbacteria bacterium]